MIKKFFLLSVIVFFLQSCRDKFENVCENIITVDNNRANTGDTVLFDSINKFKFSRVNKKDASTLVASFTLPKEQQNKALWVVFSGRVRSNFAHSNSSITLAAMSEKGECLVWRATLLKYYYTDIGWQFRCKCKHSCCTCRYAKRSHVTTKPTASIDC